MPLIIDPEFANLCPALKPGEKTGLEADLIAAGRARVALDVWGEILLDGHNRFEICTRLGLPFDVAQVPSLEAREQARNWIIDNQLNRRNLAPTEASYLRGKRYNAEKMTKAEVGQQTAAQKSRSEGGRFEVSSRSENDTCWDARGKTKDMLATELGMSASTITSDGAFAAAIDAIAENVSPETAREIRSGAIKITKKQVREIGKMEPTQQAVAIKQAKTKPKRGTATTLGKIKPMERAVISEAQKDAGKNFLHALRILCQMADEPEVLAKMTWPENWRATIDDKLIDATNYLADFSAAWKNKGTFA